MLGSFTRRLGAHAAIAALGLSLAAAPALAKNPMVGGAPMYASKTIVENAVNSKDHTTLVAAVKAAGLVDTLSGPGPFTVFAPTDDAFAKLPPETVEQLKTDADLLNKILTYHVVEGQATPDQIVGEHTTLEGQQVNVTGSGDNLKVNEAGVVCGGVTTSNAQVYLIDSVLMPPAGM